MAALLGLDSGQQSNKQSLLLLPWGDTSRPALAAAPFDLEMWGVQGRQGGLGAAPFRFLGGQYEP